jgi:outer membrane protein, multidrug efflux system
MNPFTPMYALRLQAILALSVGFAAAALAADPQPQANLAVPAQFKAVSLSAEESGSPLALPAAGSPWWTVFADPVLNRLEDQAVTSNQDLQGAIARVTEARAHTRSVASDLYPKVSAPLSASRQHSTNTGPVTTSRLIGNAFFVPSTGSTGPLTFAGQALANTYDDYQVPLTVAYEVDVFGRVSHTYKQARANAEASLADRQAVKLSLTAQVASNYFALRGADSRLAVLERAVHLRSEAEQVQDQRVKGGSATDVDLLRAKVESENTQADLIDAQQERQEFENALAVLCGLSASTFHVDAEPLEQRSPPAIPATIPAQLLTQRPDLVEAERRITAAGEGVMAARARFYPAVTVQGGYGFESSEANQLAENQSHIWSIAGAINIPIFDGGRNSAELKVARSSRDEAIAAYHETALRAFQEVEDALGNLRRRALQAEARKRAVDDARKVFEASARSYRDGGLTYFEVVDSQRVLLGAELAQVQTLSIRYAATVDLIRASGGGFWDDEAPAR